MDDDYDPYPITTLDRHLAVAGYLSAETRQIGYQLAALTGIGAVDLDRKIEHLDILLEANCLLCPAGESKEHVVTDSVSFPEDARIAVTLSAITYRKPKASPAEQRQAMQSVLADPALPTENRWRVAWGPVTVEENLSFIAEGPVVGSGPARQYAYVVRGTVIEPWNLIEDGLDALDLKDVPWDGSPDAHISKGMMLGWQNLTSASDSGQTALKFLKGVPPGSQLIVTGHSLGAMLASVMAVYLDSELSPGVGVVPYTFAAPTAGDQAFADDYARRFGGAGRYYNSLDIVPKVYGYDDVGSIKSLYPCAEAPKCNDHFVCRHLVNLAQDIAGHRYVHPAGGIRLQAKAYAESSGSFRNFLKEALDQHHVVHYMWLLGIPLEAIRVLDASWSPPEVPCPCPESPGQ